MSTNFDVAIVGGGAAAATTLIALAALPQADQLRVLWMAPAPCDGRGLAYSTPDLMHRLNVRAQCMSARADLPEDFVDFLTTRFGHADPHGFYPRRCYGAYLAERVATAWQSLRGERWEVSAQHLDHDGGAWILTGSDDTQRRADHLVLAIGPQAQQALSCVEPALLERGSYRIDPYAWVSASHANFGIRQIWIIGSGLSAVDLALTAARLHSDAQIHLISRHGALPTAHGPVQTPAADLFATQLQLPAVSQVLRELRRNIAQHGDWRALIDALRARTADRWQHWPKPEQQRFLRHLRWLWDSARHRMAPEVAAATTALQASGRLSVHRGRVMAIRAEQQRARLHWRPRGDSRIKVDSADLVLQATGFNTGLSRCTTPLLRSLLEGGLAQVDALDMGLAVDPEQRLIDGKGQVRTDAHVIGALALGSRFECIAMPEIRSTAAAIAHDLFLTDLQPIPQNGISTPD